MLSKLCDRDLNIHSIPSFVISDAEFDFISSERLEWNEGGGRSFEDSLDSASLGSNSLLLVYWFKNIRIKLPIGENFVE